MAWFYFFLFFFTSYLCIIIFINIKYTSQFMLYLVKMFNISLHGLTNSDETNL